MAKFEDFQKKHLHYLVRAAALNQKIGREKKLLDSVNVFIAELQAFLNENKKKMKSAEAAELVVWRDYWIKLTKSYKSDNTYQTL
ncbi:MAG: hypothetical protein Q7S55_04200 [Nanoarchaeota archaeon]|nr:hypothetical protein [Nanoarchaeota archaeon]